MINEPKGMTVAEVDDLNERILGIIRQTNPTRIVIYGGNMSNDYQQMNNKYNSVKNWSNANNIPIHHSEFGAVVVADFNSRMRIYAHNVELCMTNGFAYSVWDDGGDFKVLNRGQNSWPEVKDVLVHYHADSPNRIFSTLSTDPVTSEPTIVVDWNNRATGNGNIIIEKSVGSTNNFQPIATLPADATTYTDVDIINGRVYYYRMYTTRADGTLLHGYPTRLRVSGGTQSPFTGPISIPGRLEVEEYDNGGEGLAYHDSDDTNIPGGFRPEEGVDIGNNGNDFILGYVTSGEWIEYTVNVQTAGTYQVQAKVASQVANGAFRLSFDGNNATTVFNTPNTGSWSNYVTINPNTEITLEEGIQVMRLSILNNNPFNLDDLVFNITAVNVSDLEASEAGFSVTPNPTDGLVQVELTNGLQDRPAQLEVYSITGKKIKSFAVNGSSTVLDLGNYESGLYLVRLITDEVNMIHRLMVE